MKWIPTSERLPSEQGEYLVTIPLDNNSTYVDVLHFHKGKFYDTDSEWGDIEYDDVLAWMPLPEPYKADRKTEPFDKDINVRSKTMLDCYKCRRYADPTEPCVECHYEPKDEPQTEVKVEPTWVGVTYGRFEDEPQIDGAIDEARFKAHCMNCQRDVADIKCLDCDGDKYFIKDEPQTDCSWR